MDQASSVRTSVFWIQIVYLAALAGIASAYFAGALPGWLSNPQGAALSVQPGVLFFGALGGVLLSLEGVFQHRRDFDATYLFWHIARPIVGASVAVVAVLIFLAGVLAVGGVPSGGATTADKNLLYYVVAFVVGYREETFRGLIKKAADLIFTSPSGAGPVIAAIYKDHGPVDGGDNVRISGSGFTGTTAVQFGSAQAKFTVNSDAEIQATTPQVDAPCRVSVLLTTPAGSVVAPTLYEYQIPEPAAQPVPPTAPAAAPVTPTPPSPAAAPVTPTPPSPVIAAIYKDHGPVDGGDNVRISGSGLYGDHRRAVRVGAGQVHRELRC